MKVLDKIKKIINPNTYTCDSCGKPGDITNMSAYFGGVHHYKCIKNGNLRTKTD